MALLVALAWLVPGLSLMPVARSASVTESAPGLVVLPAFSDYVVDPAGALPVAARAQLIARLKDLEVRKGSQLAVLVLPSTAPEAIEQYSIRLARAWSPGRKGVNDGAILVVALNDHRVRLEVGRGLEGVIPDAYANRITDDIIVPRFRAGDVSGGIAAGVEATVRLIDGEPLPAPVKRRHAAGGEAPWVLLLILAVFVGGLLRAVFGRVAGSTLAGGVVGVAGWALIGSLWLGLIASGIGFLLSLAGGGGHQWRSGGFGGGGFGGGGFGGGGFGGGGFGGGGFGGGGGGSFGGGGASGNW